MHFGWLSLLTRETLFTHPFCSTVKVEDIKEQKEEIDTVQKQLEFNKSFVKCCFDFCCIGFLLSNVFITGILSCLSTRPNPKMLTLKICLTPTGLLGPLISDEIGHHTFSVTLRENHLLSEHPLPPSTVFSPWFYVRCVFLFMLHL